MSGIVNFEVFIVTGILLNMTPGTDTIFILTKSIGQGRQAGVVSALGIGAGCIVHTILAALGLSLIIAKSILVFTIIKYAGAAYLVYVGYKMMTDKPWFPAENIDTVLTTNYWKIFRDGMFTNILNPKVALFFIAFLPQFVDPASTNTVLPLLALGTTFIVTGTIWCLMLAIFASAIFSRLKANRIIAAYINKICGLTLIGLGIKVALVERD